MTTYLQALTDAMTEIGQRDNALIVGQAVAFPGTGMYQTFAGVPADKRVELPVFENTQLGLSIGLALAGYLPVSVFPRINFLLEAMGQLQHLDKLPLYGNGFAPRVIIRTAVATNSPLDPGVQHLGDYSAALQDMLTTVRVWSLRSPDEVASGYRKAVTAPHSTILVEYHALYGT